jgi:chromosome segregation ATPase
MIKKVVGTTKKAAHSSRRHTYKVTRTVHRSYKRHPRRNWLGTGAIAIIVVFGLLPAFAAAAPGQAGYAIKRGEESIVSNLAPLSSWRSALRLDFADNRVSEAAFVATRANENGDKNEAKTATTINGLLDTYENTYEAQTAAINQDLSNKVKVSVSSANGAQKDAVNSYTTLESLLLQAPGASQLSVLTAIDATQQNIATLNDALGVVPLSPSDFSQLAKLVSSGVMSQADVNQLVAAPSSRQLHSQIVSQIEGGDAPSDLSYVLDLDLVKQDFPAKAQVFETVAQFEQMQRISAVISASRPSAAQQQAIQAFLSSYSAGQTVPDSDIHQYVTPIVDGVLLSGQLQANLSSLNGLRMGSDDQALYVSWKGVLDPPNLSDTYQKLMTDAGAQPALHLRILTATQQELIDAQKAQVAYLVMPPGWSTDQMSTLSNQMSTQIAETSYQQSNPNTAQELASLSATQAQLQTELNNLSTTYTSSATTLQTQINNFSGTPDQLTQLKNDLATLTQNQTTTINSLQTQLSAITDAHTQLGNSIDQLRQDQVTNLTNLELRAATNAQQLTDAAKAQLTTSLNQIDSRSQTLINNLQTKVDGLTSSQAQLSSQLNGEITTIKANYQQLTTSVQAQLDAGVATSAQLQSDLSQAESTLAAQQTKVTDLTSNAAALSQLVNQVKTDSSSQIQDLQSQINVVTLSQQTTNAAVSDLQNVTQTSQGLISGLQSRVDGLSTSQATLRQDLTASIATVQNNYTQLAAYTQAQLDAGVATSTQLQTNLQTVQTTVAQQAAQLASLGTSNAALSQLVNQVKTDSTAQVSSLQSQVNGLAISQQTISTSLDALKTQQASDVTQLSSQLAGLSVLQTEAQATITALTQTQAQAQTSIDHLSTNVSTLQTAFDASQQVQASAQATIANQQSEIDSLSTQTQTALTALTQQQTQLTTQLTALAATTTTLSQAVSAVQTSASATQTQLTTLLANPPWALATAAYVTQDQLNSLSATLNTQFAQKSAQLDQQFQAYQTQLNASVTQLNNQVQSLSTTTTNTAATQTQQQSQINTLNSQVQTLQSQVQALITATTPHTGL